MGGAGRQGNRLHARTAGRDERHLDRRSGTSAARYGGGRSYYHTKHQDHGAVSNQQKWAEDIYRVNVEVPGSPLSYSFFVIKDDLPTMVETGFRRTFSEAEEALKQLVDPSTLRYIVVPHFEGDECGALNHFLELAPNAQPVASPVDAATNLADFSIREPIPLADGEVLDLGRHRLECLVTPYVHTWDSMLPFDQTTGTQF